MGEDEARSSARTSHQPNEDNGASLDPERERRYAELFAQLDLNKDGRVDISELRFGLAARGLHRGKAEEIVFESDTNRDGQLDFEEFSQYLRTHEKRLWLMFTSLDHNNDGQIDVSEIKRSLQNLGVEVTLEQASRILQSMDRDGTLTIDWNEWRDYFLFNPLHNMEEIAHHWKHSCMLDIGEALTVPDEFSERERRSGLVWRQLVAGAMAGAVSRTGTAPLDRLKVFLQGHRSEQGHPDFQLPRHILQLFRGNPEVFPGQPRDIVPSACPRSSPGSPPSGTCPEHLPIWGHLSLM